MTNREPTAASVCARAAASAVGEIRRPLRCARAALEPLRAFGTARRRSRHRPAAERPPAARPGAGARQA